MPYRHTSVKTQATAQCHNCKLCSHPRLHYKSICHKLTLLTHYMHSQTNLHNVGCAHRKWGGRTWN
eukprot:4556482-Amphidinium_carterae.1